MARGRGGRRGRQEGRREGGGGGGGGGEGEFDRSPPPPPRVSASEALWAGRSAGRGAWGGGGAREAQQARARGRLGTKGGTTTHAHVGLSWGSREGAGKASGRGRNVGQGARPRQVLTGACGRATEGEWVVGRLAQQTANGQSFWQWGCHLFSLIFPYFGG